MVEMAALRLYDPVVLSRRMEQIHTGLASNRLVHRLTRLPFFRQVLGVLQLRRDFVLDPEGDASYLWLVSIYPFTKYCILIIFWFIPRAQ